MSSSAGTPREVELRPIGDSSTSSSSLVETGDVPSTSQSQRDGSSSVETKKQEEEEEEVHVAMASGTAKSKFDLQTEKESEGNDASSSAATGPAPAPVVVDLHLASQCDQFGAVMRKNCVVKRRAWFQTCLEIISAPLLLLILLIARSISDTDYYDAVVYANQSFPLDALLGASEVVNQTANFSMADLDASASSNSTEDEFEDALSSLSSVLDYGGPLPVLFFDAFVGLSKALSSLVGTDTLETARFYTDVATNGQFGRLLKLGVLSFAIGDDQDAELFRPKLQHLVDYLNFTSVFFDEVFYRIWDSETEALEYALDAGVGLYESWAVVVFDELDPDNVDFTIRMNYTVVPDTGEIYSDFSLGTDTDYLKYYTSGFLTLQQAIGTYALVALPDRDTPGATNYSQAARDENRLPTTQEIQINLQTNIADFSDALDAFEESAIVLIDAVAAAVEAANSTNYSSCDATLLVIEAAAAAPNSSDAGSIISSVAAALQVLDPSMLDAEAFTLAAPFGTLAAAAAISASALSDDISALFGGENGLSEVFGLLLTYGNVDLSSFDFSDPATLSLLLGIVGVDTTVDLGFFQFDLADTLAQFAAGTGLSEISSLFDLLGLGGVDAASISVEGFLLAQIADICAAPTTQSNSTLSSGDQFANGTTVAPLTTRGAPQTPVEIDFEDIKSNLQTQLGTLNLVLDVAYDLVGNDIAAAQAHVTLFLAGGGDIVAASISFGVVQLFASDAVQSAIVTAEALLGDEDTLEAVARLGRTLGDLVESGLPLYISMLMPEKAYLVNRFYSAVGPIIGLVLCMSTLYPVAMLIKVLVEEKESRVKETMKIMGLSDFVYNLGWFTVAACEWFLIAVASTLVVGEGVLPRSETSLFFVYFLLFSLSEIAFCFMLATFFSRSMLAAIIGPIALFAFLMIRYVLFATPASELAWAKWLISLLSPSAFAFGGDTISSFEGADVGMSWDFVNVGAFPFSASLIMMAVDSFLYFFIAWYFDKVLPKAYGTTHPPHFMCTRRFWRSYCFNPAKEAPEYSYRIKPDDILTEAGTGVVRTRSISIHNLRKVFRVNGDGDCGSRKKVALNNFSLDVYKDQITALLGHNGAGKSTTMSILTGLIRPTSGSCTIMGLPIQREMDLIRQFLGLCPQHNVLFPRLSVVEHLLCFGVLKGIPADSASLHAAVDEVLEAVGLDDKKDAIATEMSGGQKRKLSVAIALIGGSNVVFLDEPTSGMDPYSRRDTWELLRKSRKGRTIILTTHFMDEADLLGDRIAIMHSGALRAVGSSLELKTKFGIGYQLRVVKAQVQRYGTLDQPEVQAEANDLEAGPSSRVKIGKKKNTAATNDEITDKARKKGAEDAMAAAAAAETDRAIIAAVRKHVPGAVVLSSSGGELALQLPLESVGDFPAVLQQLEADVQFTNDNDDMKAGRRVAAVSSKQLNARGAVDSKAGDEVDGLNDESHDARDPLNVTGFGLSVTSLEEVFLRLNEDSSDDGDDTKCDAAGMENDVAIDVGASDHTDGAQDHHNQGKEDDTNAAHDDAHNKHSANLELDGRTPVSIWNVEPVARSCTRQWRSMFRKRWIAFKRDIKGIVFQVLLPVVFVALIMLTLTADISPVGPRIQLAVELFDQDVFSRDNSFDIYNQPNFDGNATQWLVDSAFESVADSGQWPTGVSFTTWDAAQYARVEGQSLEDWDYAADELNTWDSLNLSMALLDEYDSHGRQGRYTAYVWDDELLNISVPTALTSGDPADLLQLVNVLLPLLNSTSGGNASASGGIDLAGLLAVLNTIPSTSMPVYEALEALGAPIGQVSVLHNASTKHALPSSITDHIRRLLFDRRRERGTVGDSDSMEKDAYFHIRSEALPLTVYEDLSLQLFLNLFVALFLLVPFSYFPATFAMFIVKERVSKSKHLQQVSGVGTFTYWTSALVWDLVNFIAIIICTLLIMWAFDSSAFIGTWPRIGATFLLFLLYAAAAVPFSYLLSFGFKTHASAQVGITVINFLLGFVLVLASFIMDADEDTEEANSYLVYVWRLSPHFNLGETFIAIASADLIALLGQSAGEATAWENNGLNYLMLGLEFLFFFAMVLLKDSGACACRENDTSSYRDAHDAKFDQRITPDMDGDAIEALAVATAGGDDDVSMEAQRIGRGELGKDDIIVMDRLRKVYPGRHRCCGSRKGDKKQGAVPPHVAVRRMSLGIRRGECFGFLGVNGAGKTSTLQVLTGDIKSTDGSAQILGLDVGSQMERVQSHLGYCPQFDPLLDLMTGRETLTMFARLKGLPEEFLDQGVESALKDLGLWEYRDRNCGGYSGGNKRKLSLGIALIGNPDVIFLDEPSTGMDPVARRHMWDVITSRMTRSCICLTSHSMEECEALCTRVGIMAAGGLRCLGGVQHLKGLYGQGYLLEISAKDLDCAAKVKTFVAEKFPLAVLAEEYGVYLRYTLALTAAGSTPAPAIESAVPQTVDVEDLELNIATTEAKMTSLSSQIAEATERKNFDEIAPLGEEMTSLSDKLRDMKAKLHSLPASAETAVHRTGGTDGEASTQVHLSEIFREIEEHKVELGVGQYSLSQPTLEQVFIRIAKTVDAEEGHKPASE